MKNPSLSDRRVIALLVLMNLSIPIFVFLQHTRKDVSIWTGWLSAVIANVAFLSGVYRQRRRAGQQMRLMFLYSAGALAVLSGLITTSFSRRQSNSDLELMRSNTPLSEIEPERKRLVVELGRRNAASSAENERAAMALKPISPPLYSVNSFASKAAMESTTSQLQKAYELDKTYAAALHHSMQDFHEKMLKVDPEYLRQFETAESDYSAQQAAIESAEEIWITSTFGLYKYAIDHADAISVDQNGNLIFTDQDVRKSLLRQIDQSKDLQQKMMEARSAALDTQHKAQN